MGKSNILKLFFLLLLILFYGCNKKVEKIAYQDKSNRIVLRSANAIKVDTKHEWTFFVNNTGKFNIQILCDEKITDLPKIDIETDEFILSEKPEKIFVIGSEGASQTVFQFKKNLTIKEKGAHKLAASISSPFTTIRILPNYKTDLGFSSGKYDKEWQKMHNSEEKQNTLDWFKKAKYGMFIHWGLYSQAGGIWKGQKMEESSYSGPAVSEWLMYKFHISRNEYAQLAKTFNPDKSFAQNIANLAKESGMKYVVLTAKHHDGFALFDSKCSSYDIIDATPYKLDAVKELYNACLAEGLAFGVYYSHGVDWFDGTDGNYSSVKERNDSLGILTHDQGKNLWDPSPNTFDEYIENKSLPQVKELLKLLPKLSLIWFDGEGFITEDQSFKFYKTIFDINPHVIVNRRVGYTFGDYLDAGDNVIPSSNDIMLKPWETCGTTNNSWAFKSYDNDWKSTQELLYYLVDIASKGGNYLLNIGPDGKGNVPVKSAKVLREVGKWLKINGDAIYGTTKWKIRKEGTEKALLKGTGDRAKKGFLGSFSSEDLWFTAKDNKVYVISLVKPKSHIKIKSLKTQNGIVEKVRLLGNSKRIEWKQNKLSMDVDLRNLKGYNNGFVLEVTIKK